MKLNYLKINGFGKIKNKEINFDDKLTLIYGKNEAGKTTILKSLISTLYGANKNKNGENISVLEKYKPWGFDEYSGKIEYLLDNGEKYEIFREYLKRNPKIYNKNNEDISALFNNDKTKGINPLYEQTKIDEELFLNSSIINQDRILLEKNEQLNIIQKISNSISTRDDNVSFKKSIEKINKKLNNEIGTDRTTEKPINKINEKINNLENEKNNYLENINKNQNNINRKKEIEEKIINQENKIKILKKINNIKIKYEENNTEKNINNILNNEIDNKITNLNIEIEELESILNTKEKNNKKLLVILPIIFSIITVFLVVIKFNNLINIISLIISILFWLLFFVLIIKEKINSKNKIKEINNKIENKLEKINEYKDSKKRRIEEIENINNKKLIEKNKEKNKIEIEEARNISVTEIENLFKLDLDSFEAEMELNEEKLNGLKLEKNVIDIELRNNNLNNEKIIKIEEELNNAYKEKEELKKLENSINIAKECLEIAYEKMKENINPNFMLELSKDIERITDGKYKKIIFNDSEGLKVELENGDYVLAERLSKGTIDQMYLALRINILKEITEEKMPIIFDEAFAYFDDERIINTLELLNNKYNNQVIIFSCTDREKNILNKLNINYKLVEI